MCKNEDLQLSIFPFLLLSILLAVLLCQFRPCLEREAAHRCLPIACVDEKIMSGVDVPLAYHPAAVLQATDHAIRTLQAVQQPCANPQIDPPFLRPTCCQGCGNKGAGRGWCGWAS